MKTRTLVLLVVLALCALSQTLSKAPSFSTGVPANVDYYETGLFLVSTSPTTVVTGDFWLEELTLSGITTASPTCTITDYSSSNPVTLFNNTVTPGIYVMEFKALKMTGGIRMRCDTANAVNASIRGKKIR